MTKTDPNIKIIEIVGYIDSVIGVGLALRLILQLFGANTSSGFVQLVYELTAPLIAPFTGIFDPIRFGEGVIEPAAILGLILYPLLIQLILKLLLITSHK